MEIMVLAFFGLGLIFNMFGAIWLLVLATGLALITGYITLASYMVGNIVVIGVVVSFLYCIRRLADAFVAQSVSEGGRISNTLKYAFSMSEQGIKRAGIALNAFVDFTLLLLGLPLLLTLTALSWVDVRSWFATAFFGFDIGDITISLSSILLAIGVFVIGLLLTRLITGWLDRRILSATNLDAGVRILQQRLHAAGLPHGELASTGTQA